MARLIYIMNVSLDGYVADRDGNFGWSDPTPELFTAILELVRPVGTYLYGRRLYETMAVWEAANLEPAAPAFTRSSTRSSSAAAIRGCRRISAFRWS